MIRFTDPNLYVKGTCAVQFANTNSGDIEFWSDKVQTFNATSNANEDVIRAGLGNGIATVLTNDSEITVSATAANFSLKAKAMQLGGSAQYNGIAPVCKTVTAASTSLIVDVTDGTPVANYGFSSPMCYVQEVGASSPIGTYGKAYAINATTGAITGFAATASKKYKVWYFVKKAAAYEATFFANFQPGVYHVTYQLAVYRNLSGAGSNNGTRVGWLYCIYPRYKMTPGGGMVGDQTTADTTDLSGRALPIDSDVISDQCADCEMGAAAYYLYVPDDGSDAIVGILAQIGGVISVVKSGSAQVQPRFIMANDQIVPAESMSGFTFALSGAPTGTTVGASTGVISAGSTAGDCELNVTYTSGSTTYTDVCNVSVVES